MKTGTVFDIKEFAVYDGPGIRQTVFLKGCPLRCNWCHNPEGLSAKREITVNRNSCVKCGKCTSNCNKEICDLCGECVKRCTGGFRKICGTVMTSGELAELIIKNDGYYRKYEGGVTFSGGEPLMQNEFLLEVLEKIKGVHTAIETSGYADKKIFENVINSIDYIMIDIKMIDNDQHKKYTGVSNKKILENARILIEGNKPFIIRIPLIPGVNDTDENLKNTAEFFKDAKNLIKAELLPYHKTAGAKYSMTDKGYKPLFDINKEVNRNIKIFNEYGMEADIL